MSMRAIAKERKSYPQFVFNGTHFGCLSIAWSNETNIIKLIELCKFSGSTETPKVDLWQKTNRTIKATGTPLYERVGFVNINLGTLEKGDGKEMFIKAQDGAFKAENFMKYGIHVINAE